jgi:hypothetical protein
VRRDAYAPCISHKRRRIRASISCVSGEACLRVFWSRNFKMRALLVALPCSRCGRGYTPHERRRVQDAGRRKAVTDLEEGGRKRDFAGNELMR